MKKQFEIPEMCVEKLEVVDVITTSTVVIEPTEGNDTPKDEI